MNDPRVPTQSEHAEREYFEEKAPYAEWLEWYRSVEYARYTHPDVTVDCVIVTVDNAALNADPAHCLKALAVDRWTHPFRGYRSLPGTFMRTDDVDDVAVIDRMLRTRFSAGVEVPHHHVRQLQTFTGRNRDPRGQIVSIANIVYLAGACAVIPESEGLHWMPVLELAETELAFDHRQIMLAAVERIRSQFAWNPNVFWTLTAPFTVTDALKLRASLFGEDYKTLNRKNFKRKYESIWVKDGVEINPITDMPVDLYRYEGIDGDTHAPHADRS